MSLAPQDQVQLEPSAPTAARPDEAASEQLIPAKREPDDEIQFISSQPIKKMRVDGEGSENGGHITETPASGPGGEGQARHDDDTSRPDRSVSALPLGLPSHLSAIPAWENRGTSLPAMENFSFSTACSTVSARPPTSAAVSPKQLPPMTSPSVVQGNTSHPGQTPAASRSAIDQVSCLDVGDPVDFSNMNAAANHGNMNSFSNWSDNMNAMTNPSMSAISNMANTATLSRSNMPSFVPDPSSTGVSTPHMNYSQSGYIPLNNPAPMPFAMYSMGNLVPMPQIPQSFNSSLMGMTGSLGLPGSQAFQPQPPAGPGGFATNIAPTWTSAQENYPGLQHPHSPQTPQVAKRSLNPPSLSSPVLNQSSLNSEYRGNASQPIVSQKRPCLACAAARSKQRCNAPSHGFRPHGNTPLHPSQPHSRPDVAGLQNQVYPQMRPTANGNTIQQNTQMKTGTQDGSVPAYTYPRALEANPGASNGIQAGTLPDPGHSPFAMTGTVSPSVHMSNRSGEGESRDFAPAANPLPSALNPAVAPNQHTTAASLDRSASPAPLSSTRQPTPAVPPPTTAPPSSTPKPMPGQPYPHSHPHQIQHQQQQPPQLSPQSQPQQHHPPPPPPPPSQAKPPAPPAPPPAPSPTPPTVSISAAAAAAAAHAAQRKRHAANVLVDVAELVAATFPFEVVARRHGTLPRKVAEAVAAVVQVPLLRCATDKRRAGRLGADRMREFREARKEWVAMVREWERERKGGGGKEREKEREKREGLGEGSGDGHAGEMDAEGEPEYPLIMGGGGPWNGPGNGQGATGAGAAAGGPAEPSALDVALLLPPTEMPGLVLQEGFFRGPW